MQIRAFIRSGLIIWYMSLTILILAIFPFKNIANAGAYIFAGESNGVDIITHPTGYNGSGGQITVGVCIDSTSSNAADMVVPFQNMEGTFNKLQAHSPNLISGIASSTPSSFVDFESVALHELGHCLSLAHPNIGGGVSPATNYTASTDGADNVINQGAGTDTIIGSKDDQRGDDVNLHWFNKSTNNPCAIENAIVDTMTFSRAVADLPNTDAFAANADRDVCADLGVPDTEAVMQQLTFTGEDQRRLAEDDISTLKLGMSGLDGLAGTADDYTFNVVSHGVVVNPDTNPDCDVIADFDNTRTGFAICQVQGTILSANHAAITSANIYFNTGANWHFNDVLDSDIFCGGGLLIEGADINLSNQVITDERRFEATQTITVGTGFEVNPTGCLSLSAATSIKFESGFNVKAGALFKAVIE